MQSFIYHNNSYRVLLCSSALGKGLVLFHQQTEFEVVDILRWFALSCVRVCSEATLSPQSEEQPQCREVCLVCSSGLCSGRLFSSSPLVEPEVAAYLHLSLWYSTLMTS